ncbi:MAG TPA: hypothetical protein PK926_16370 [Spirochaetota bacterium]|nr:hypothetical protein [Spirochaetota bacterium]HPI90444.1 hypothetical protein [Spirochaetota bacterium]HPR49353.1 hypothetical protein [Spirochaetota bacterium]
MSIETLIQNFGYPAIIAGTFFEGETALVLGGFAAHRGYLNLYLVMLSAFIGSSLGDQIYFFLGRKKGPSMLKKMPMMENKIARFRNLLEKILISDHPCSSCSFSLFFS